MQIECMINTGRGRIATSIRLQHQTWVCHRVEFQAVFRESYTVPIELFFGIGCHRVILDHTVPGTDIDITDIHQSRSQTGSHHTQIVNCVCTDL